jgi:enoyl-CoA hydratase
MSDKESQFVHSTLHDNGVIVVTINRPARRNALNLEIKRKLADAVLAADRDDAVRVIVLVGADRCFIAGTDLDEQIEMTPTDHILLETDGIFSALRRCTKPLIAAVEGYALGGGCEIALACDLIVAGRTAKFGLPEVRLGVMPGAGGTQRLMRTIGRYKTMRIVLTGEFIEGQDAYDMGFVSEVTEDGGALDRALEQAARIAAMPPLSVKSIKEVAQAGADMSLDAALLLERKAFQVLFDSADQSEGMGAFVEKRKPVFKGR